MDGLVRQVLEALLVGDPERVTVFTPDVQVDTPFLVAEGRDELRDRLEDRRDAYTDLELVVDGCEVGGVVVDVSWRFTATHSGPLLVNEDEYYEPTGERVQARGVTHLDVRDGCISSVRVELEEPDGSVAEEPELP
jgi:hypothetical protein